MSQMGQICDASPALDGGTDPEADVLRSQLGP
jgi:hypothetical protein